MNNLRQNVDLKNNLQTTVFITPQMKQSIAMLQMPLQELATEIAAILEENPILETIDGDGSSDFEEDFSDQDADKDAQQDDQEEKEKVENDLSEVVTSDDWEEYIGYEKGDDISYRPMNDDEGVDFEQFVGSEAPLYEFLLNQLKISGLSAKEREIGIYIIGNLSDDGYCRIDKDEACEELDIDIEDFESVLDVIKTFEPSGIASECFCECVVTQLKDIKIEEVYIEFTKELLENCANELSSFKYDEILKKMSIERDTLDYLLELIKKTDPRPGKNFRASQTNIITPDVFIIPNGSKFDILLNESGLPSIRLNNYYTKMLKGDTKLDDGAKQYIKDKVKNAIWVIESLQKRQKAIYKVANALANFQAEFLRDGETKLKPLKLKEVAEATELHESTISRVTAGKYAMTPRGMIELKSFFSKSLDTFDGDMSVAIVKNKIKEFIDNEDKNNPLSDQRLVELMDAAGVKIARRTVAKYRDELNILTMSQRKRVKA